MYDIIHNWKVNSVLANKLPCNVPLYHAICHTIFHAFPSFTSFWCYFSSEDDEEKRWILFYIFDGCTCLNTHVNCMFLDETTYSVCVVDVWCNTLECCSFGNFGLIYLYNCALFSLSLLVIGLYGISLFWDCASDLPLCFLLGFLGMLDDFFSLSTGYICYTF